VPSINALPPWMMFVVTLASVVIAMFVGYRCGLTAKKRSAEPPQGAVGSVVGAVLGLLAFMMAFTFGMTANRFDTRKQLLLEEANSIAATYRRAGLLPSPQDETCRALLREYVDVRIQAVGSPDLLRVALVRCSDIHRELWSHAVTLARADMNSDIGALFVESLDDTINLHTSRVIVALQYRIPTSIWTLLILLAVLSMGGVGYQFGIGGRGSVALMLVLSVSFSLVVLLIAELDSTLKGSIKVDQQPMIFLQEMMEVDGALEGKPAAGPPVERSRHESI
jgi:CDP-diglyceride synthetase